MLLATRRFLPLFATQLLGAVNDNLFKNALVVLILFRGSANPLLVPLAGGIFILPYALFSATAGQLADRLDKARLIRLTKLFEVGLMLLAAVGLLAGSEGFLLLVLFGLGVQATFFGPLKYGALPELLARDELLGGNALIEAGTFIGILLGTVLGGVLVLLDHGRLVTTLALLGVAAAGLGTAFGVPRLPPAAPTLRIAANIFGETVRLLGEARRQRVVWQCILALSWFWALGATFLAEFPVIVQQRFGAQGQVVTLMLAVFSVGIGAGSLLAGALLRGRVSARPVVPALLVLSLCGVDFAWAAGHVHPVDGLTDITRLLAHGQGLRILFDLFGVACAGGVFSVPLYALLQRHAAAAWRARMIAANNVMNAAFMVVGAGLLAAGSAAGLAPEICLLCFVVANLAVAFLLWRARLP